MKNLYGEFTSEQIAQTKKSLRGSIFLLLLRVDPNTAHEYENIDVTKFIKGLQLKLSGLNELLLFPPEIVKVMTLLQAALVEYNNPQFNFSIYRKLILDAGAEVEKLDINNNLKGV